MTGQRISWLGWILGVFLCLQSVAVAQQPQGSGIPPGDVEEVLADNARKNAEQRRQQAKQWREMAEKARARAAEASERAEKEIWENTAKRREEEARKLDAEADEFEKEAVEHAAKAEQKKAQVAAEQAAKAAEEKTKGAQSEPEPPAEPAEVGKAGDDTQPPVEPVELGKTVPGAAGESQEAWVPVESLLGGWFTDYDSSEIRIEAIDPDKPERKEGLRLTTKRHTYVGSYVPGAKPQPARLTFSRRPKAEEMNREVPLWARQMVQDKLEWVFQFDEIDDCLCSGIKGKWSPGEITWREDGTTREARVSGKGEPVEFTYQPKPPDPTEQVKAPVLFVQSNDTRVSPFEPQQTVAFKSPFRIQVLLPRELAEKQGGELTVQLKAEKTWSSASVTLKGSPLPSGVWSYMTDPPVTLVPVPTTGNTTWFRADHGELVTATYTAPGGETTSEVFSIYQNNIYQAMARNEETLAWLESTYETLLGPRVLFDGRQITPRERQILEQKLKLVRNAQKILARNLPELVAVGVGDVYIQLIQREPLEGDLRFGGGDDQSYDVPGRYVADIDWVDKIEKQQVYAAISEARDRYTNIFVNLVRDFGVDTFYGLFLSQIDQALIVFGGTDIQGRSYDTASRVLAGIQGVTNIALAGIMGSLASKAQEAKMPRAKAERLARREQRNAREGALRAAAVAEAAERINSGLSPAALRGANQPKLMSNPRTKAAGPGEPAAFHENLDGLPASAAFDPAPANRLPDPLYQCRGNVCAIMSTVHAGRKKGRAVPFEERILARMAEQFGLLDDQGIRSGLMPKLARLLGLDHEFRKRMTLAEAAQALERGEAVVGGMFYLDEQGRQIRPSGHAFHILEILKSSATAQPTYVKYWDPGTGRRIGILACDFLKIYDPRDVLIIK